MEGVNKDILAVNGGSSSIKFALFGSEGPLRRLLSGKIDRIGQDRSELTFSDNRNNETGRVAVKAPGIPEAAGFLFGWLKHIKGVGSPAGVGHRVVHGLTHRQPMLVDDTLLDQLRAIDSYDPDHLPGELELIRLFREHDPAIPQVACFDTVFHATLPPVARLLPIPRRYGGLQRYGFHGISYAYLLEELTRVAGPDIAGGSVVMAHLGSGASLAAVKEGRSVDTTMGFTPTGGIMMGTRTGDLDPGVIWWLLQNEKLTADQLNDLVNHQSGLLGVSGISGDMQELLGRESSDEHAANAVAMFCYQVKKTIGAYTAVLGGIDALVFSGGIGEKAAMIRSRVCAGLECLGIGLDQRANGDNALLISAKGTRVPVYVIPTDEELMIARTVRQFI